MSDDDNAFQVAPGAYMTVRTKHLGELPTVSGGGGGGTGTITIDDPISSDSGDYMYFVASPSAATDTIPLPPADMAWALKAQLDQATEHGHAIDDTALQALADAIERYRCYRRR